MRLLYDVGGGVEDFVICPVCGRRDFGYDKIEYPLTMIKCLTCGMVLAFKKHLREIKEVSDDSVQSK